MKRKLPIIFWIFLLAAMLASGVICFIFALKTSNQAGVKALVGFLCGVIFAPILHELGHALFAKNAKMQIVYLKCFIFQWLRKGGKLRFSFASPFSSDQTQIVPKSSGNMQKRFLFFTLGGLILEGAFLLCMLVLSLVFTLCFSKNYFFWGTVPYLAYLFFLNAVPMEYASGKTDALIAKNLKKGASVEKATCTALEIQGKLFEGQTFAQIDGDLYNSFPVLCEEEPMFAMILHLKYRKYLEENELEKAAECLNRLLSSQEYLPQAELEKYAAELVYMHSVFGNRLLAQDSAKYCEDYLKSEEVAAKRALAAYCLAFGKYDAVMPLLTQARALLAKESILGLAKSEEKLLLQLEQSLEQSLEKSLEECEENA